MIGEEKLRGGWYWFFGAEKLHFFPRAPAWMGGSSLARSLCGLTEGRVGLSNAENIVNHHGRCSKCEKSLNANRNQYEL